MRRLRVFNLILIVFFINLFIQSANLRAQIAERSIGVENSIEEAKQILFINIAISEQEDSLKEALQLMNIILADGVLKQDFNKEMLWEEGRLACSFLNEQEELIKRVSIENPLHKNYEYVGEDNKLHTKRVDYKDATFSLRTQLSNDIIYLRIDKIIDGHEFIHLKTFKL